MPSFITGTVSAVLSERRGLQRIEVDGRRAYVLTRLIGPVVVGDRVVVNTTAVELQLGTGGWDVVHWNLSRDAWSEPGPGHVMKLRYTSLQADTGAVEERDDYEPGADLGGMPVVACALHSQLAAVAAAFTNTRSEASLAYVMTDAGALPLALSDLVDQLMSRGLLRFTVTAGQAFGGDHEAVNVASALDVAASQGADAVVVATGPGGVGTATRRGFSALEVAGIVDFTERLGGRPIVAVRYSDADDRPRHRGVSHHTLAALEYAHARALVPVPRGRASTAFGTHEVLEIDVPDVPALLAGHGLRVTSMGRAPGDDPWFHAYAGAAGVAAAMLLAVA